MSTTKRYNNKDYSRLRQQFVEVRSLQMQGELNHMFGKTHTQAAKQIMSTVNLGKVRSDEHRTAISNAQTGKSVSETTRQKLREAHIGKIVSPETRAKLSNSLSGKTRNIESIERQRTTNTGSGNPNFGNGQAVTGEKNGMYGRKWYVNQDGERIVTHPNDPRLKTRVWQNRKEWK
jgi:hypothetical protein